MPKTNTSAQGKFAQTVLGPVAADALGITLPHEHLLIDMTVWFVEPDQPAARELARQPVQLSNLGWLNFNQYNNLDNVCLLDEDLAARELALFKQAGGSTIVDVTTRGLVPNFPALKRLAQATGLNIIGGCGYYVLRGDEAREFDAKSEDQIVEEIVADILVGVGDTGIRAGIIGEIGCSWPLLDREKKSLRAAARAQQHTGAPITIHPGRGEDSPLEILAILGDAGADLGNVVMGHIDRTGFAPATIRAIAATGCYLEYDIFGGNPFYPLHLGVFRRPCDRERIEQIAELIEEGFLGKILISQDVCLKTKLVSYGGPGYSHILRNIVPQMLARGITESHLHTLMVENPRNLLCFLKESL